MNIENQRFSLTVAVFIGSFIGLASSTSCSLIVGDLCPNESCEEESATPFGGAGGSAGAGGDAATGGVAGTGGTGGDAGSGNVVTGGGGTGGTGGTTTAGGGGSGGTGGTGCDASHKDCGGNCVLIDDPLYGCGPVDCDPCLVANATATCSQGACAIDTCDTGFDDCANGVSDGCEQDLLSDPDHCGGCDQLCEDYTAQPCQAGKCNPGCGAENIPITTEGYAFCYVIDQADHSPNLILGIGATFIKHSDDQVYPMTFPIPGCQAPNATANQVVCNGVDLKSGAGTYLKIRLGYSAGPGSPAFLCDSTSFPEHCKGTVTLYGNGEVLGSMTHPMDTPNPPFDTCDAEGYWGPCILDPPGVPPLP